jgi:hypothetical protein
MGDLKQIKLFQSAWSICHRIGPIIKENVHLNLVSSVWHSNVNNVHAQCTIIPNPSASSYCDLFMKT